MSDTSETAPSPAGEPALPEVLRARYRVEAELGRGSMGVVYRAYDRRLDRKAAIKELYPTLARVEESSRAQVRFLREARISARLTHPNIVTIFDIVHVEGRWFMVMELLEGRSLRQIMKERQTVSLEETRTWMLHAARGLEAAHRTGVVHRDIKPENLMLQPDGWVKIMDFGIALSRDTPRLTGIGGTMGTPAYLAPELLKGAPADARSDLFALGVVAYELLAGFNPYIGGTVTQVLFRIASTVPTRLDQMQPFIPTPAASIIEKLMVADPSARYQTATELIAELERLPGALLEPPAVLDDVSTLNGQKRAGAQTGVTVAAAGQGTSGGDVPETLPGMDARVTAPGAGRGRTNGTARDATVGGAAREAVPGTAREAFPGAVRKAVPGTAREAVPGAAREAFPGASSGAAPTPGRAVANGSAARDVGAGAPSREVGPRSRAGDASEDVLLSGEPAASDAVTADPDALYVPPAWPVSRRVALAALTALVVSVVGGGLIWLAFGGRADDADRALAATTDSRQVGSQAAISRSQPGSSTSKRSAAAVVPGTRPPGSSPATTATKAPFLARTTAPLPAQHPTGIGAAPAPRPATGDTTGAATDTYVIAANVPAATRARLIKSRECDRFKKDHRKMECLEENLSDLPADVQVPPEAAPLLLRLMEQDALLERSLALAPRIVPKKQLVKKLTGWLDHPDASRRHESAEALEALGKPVPEVDLRRRDLRDSSCPVRRDAAQYFVDHPTPSVKADLKTALDQSVTRVEKPTTGPLSLFKKTKTETNPHCDHDALAAALRALEGR